MVGLLHGLQALEGEPSDEVEEAAAARGDIGDRRRLRDDLRHRGDAAVAAAVLIDRDPEGRDAFAGAGHRGLVDEGEVRIV